MEDTYSRNSTTALGHCGLNARCPHRLVCLSSWPPAGVTIYGAFSRWSIAGGNGSLGCVLRFSRPASLLIHCLPPDFRCNVTGQLPHITLSHHGGLCLVKLQAKLKPSTSKSSRHVCSHQQQTSTGRGVCLKKRSSSNRS